jgi:hypothetical protein
MAKGSIVQENPAVKAGSLDLKNLKQITFFFLLSLLLEGYFNQAYSAFLE